MQSSDSAFTENHVLELRKRLLKACLAPTILVLLMEKNVASATNIIAFLRKRYDIQLSAGTVYPVLYSLERDGKIRITYNRITRIYILTNKGRLLIENIQKESESLHTLITELIGKQQ